MIYDILPVNNYTGNNSTTTFDFDFYIESADELKVYLFGSNGTKTLLTNEVDYLINELKNPEGSYITYPIAGSTHTTLKDDEKISLQMYLPISQETQYNNSSLLNLSALESSFDYLTRLVQIVSRKVDLCIKAEEGTSVVPSEIIDNVVQLGSAVLEQAHELEDTLETLDDLVDDATEKYNTVVNNAELISSMQDDITDLTTNKANASGDNFSSSIKAMDGQWVFPSNTPTTLTLDNSTSDKQTFNLATFFPDDSYSYELMIAAEFHHNVSGGNTLYMFLKPLGNGTTAVPFMFSSSSSQHQHNFAIVPIGTERAIAFKTDSSGFTTGEIKLLAYRRIGTNS